jgi:hypothetical protein
MSNEKQSFDAQLIKKTGAEFQAKGLSLYKDNSTKELDLSNNAEASESGVLLVLSTLIVNNTLKKVNMSDNSMALSSGITSMLIAVLNANRTLDSLDLSGAYHFPGTICFYPAVQKSEVIELVNAVKNNGNITELKLPEMFAVESGEKTLSRKPKSDGFATKAQNTVDLHCGNNKVRKIEKHAAAALFVLNNLYKDDNGNTNKDVAGNIAKTIIALHNKDIAAQNDEIKAHNKKCTGLDANKKKPLKKSLEKLVESKNKYEAKNSNNTNDKEEESTTKASSTTSKTGRGRS